MSFISRFICRMLGHQHWIKYPLRRRLISNFHDPETAVSETFSVDFFGLRYEGNFNSYLDWNVYYFGSFSTEELMLFKGILGTRQSPVVLDVGGNVGHHAIFYSTLAGQVFTFEPFPPLVEQIQQKVDSNHLSNVIVCGVGLGEEDADLLYNPPDDNHQGLGSFIRETSTDPTTLQVVQGDRYLAKFNLTKLDLVKLDVEGFELYVLKGLRHTLETFRPAIFLEWTVETESTLDKDFFDYFPDGYRCFEFIDNSWRPRFRILRYPGYELIEVIGNIPYANLLVIPSELLGPYVNAQVPLRFARSK